MIIAFIPVLHRGYLELFKEDSTILYILGEDIIKDYTGPLRDLRTINPAQLQQAIIGLNLFKTVKVLDKRALIELNNISTEQIIMPNEDISRDLAQKYLTKQTIHYKNIFLRWDGLLSKQESVISPNRQISREQMHQELIQEAKHEAQKSADFWRQVGAVITQNQNIISQAYNKHLPTDFHLMQNGDPRSNFDAGTNTSIYTAIHAEANAIATAAKEGQKLDGASIFVTTFPCPNCARLIALSGIKQVYYEQGYSLLDAEEIFKTFNIEIIYITT